MSPEQLAYRVFSIADENSFTNLALEIFRFQAKNNPIYSKYLQLLKIEPEGIQQLSQLPFLPIEFFKTHEVISGQRVTELSFQSSGTTGDIRSKHLISNQTIYVQSFTKGFELFYGKPNNYTFLALLPSYIENGNSSLIYMINKLINISNKPESGFYLNNIAEFIDKIIKLEKIGEKYILIGVSYALIELADEYSKKKYPKLEHGIVMETGGMKGMRKDLIKTELHSVLKKAFSLNEIHSEYGMTELLSQAYSKGGGVFNCPPWMKVLIRDTNDPFKVIGTNRTGGINVIDLANIYSCSFIATQDLGKLNPENTFELLGRFDSSELRGCNLLIN